MATVTYILRKGQPLSEEEREELRALKNRPIVFDEDCPELTDEQLSRMRRVNPVVDTGAKVLSGRTG